MTNYFTLQWYAIKFLIIFNFFFVWATFLLLLALASKMLHVLAYIYHNWSTWILEYLNIKLHTRPIIYSNWSHDLKMSPLLFLFLFRKWKSSLINLCSAFFVYRMWHCPKQQYFFFFNLCPREKCQFVFERIGFVMRKEKVEN